MTEVVDAAGLSDDNLTWLWAAQDCLQLFDKHDSKWIELSNNNSWSDCDLRSFLKAYGLLRGKNGSNLANSDKNRMNFIEIVNKIVEANQPKCLKDSGHAWEQICVELAEQKISLSNNGLRSAASKLLWFHLPVCWTMQDSYNFSGLHSWLRDNRLTKKESLQIPNFVNCFSQFFDQNKMFADWAASSTIRGYPYTIRIAEKYLWLKGSGKQAETINFFRHSLEALNYNVDKPPQ